MDYNKLQKNNSERNYAYNFDTDVMHHYFIKTFQPYFQPGNILEIGCSEGLFTKRLFEINKNITSIEVSDEAISKAKILVPEVSFINSKFEDYDFKDLKYDNIIITHILEHVDNPVEFLRKASSLLSPDGRLILCCPNANAVSRQIAVKMNLISTTTDVSEGERLQGHQRTYTLDSLTEDALDANLKIIKASGIFFKALANFQWDQVINQKIVSEEYLDGCFKLGKDYPNLCSSIYLICNK